MKKRVEFIFDFASPNAYLAKKACDQLFDPAEVEILFKPVLLGGIFKATGNQAPMLAYGHVKPKLDYDMLEMQRFIAHYDLSKFKFNPHFPVNTLLMMRAAIVAQNEEKLERYIEAGLSMIWEQERNMQDPEVFIAALNEAGFDGAAWLEKTADPDVKQALIEETQKAVERGVFGVPTFLLAKKSILVKTGFIR